MIMRDTIFCAVPPDADRDAIVASRSYAMVPAVQEYVPGYRLLQEPQFDDPSAATRGRPRCRIFVEVEGAGDYLPPYAGNLDIMTAAATRVGEHDRPDPWQRGPAVSHAEHPRPHLVRRPRPAAHRHLPARRVAPQAPPVHRAARCATSSSALDAAGRAGHRGDPRRRPRRLELQLRLLARPPEQELIKIAAETAKRAKIAFLMLPGRRHQGRHPRGAGQRRPDLPDRHPLHRGRRLDAALRRWPASSAWRPSAS